MPTWLGDPVPGVWLPNFAAFNGQDSNGAWELFVYDDAGADTGTLQNWSIDFNPGAPPPPPPGPPGDACADAISIPGPGVYSFDNNGANTDYVAFCTPGYGDLFYAWTPNFTGTARVSTCGLTSLDTTLTALSGCGGFELACNDDACGLQSRIEFPVTSGVPVIIRVASWSSSTRGSGSFSVEEVAPATNDLCSNATAVGEGSFAFDNSGAGGEIPSACGFGGDPGGADIFFRYTASFTGLVEINTCGSSLDSQIDVASDCSFSSVIACNDDSCGLQSRVIFDVTAGTEYLVRVAGWGGETGPGTLNIFQIFPGPQPNDLCQNATPVSDGIEFFDTTGALPGGPGACGASAGSPDIFYLWTPANDGCGTIETCGSGYDTVLEIVSSCGGSSVLCNDDACGLQSRLSIPNVQAGVPILVRVSGFAGGAGAGQITFTSSPATPYNAPSGTPEGEPCVEASGDTYNAGCNSTPPTYLPLARCQTYVGTSWFNTGIGFRDTDWYEFTLTEAQNVTVSGQARFSAQLYFLEIIDCGTGQISLISAANNSACDPSFTMSASLPAGTWYVFIAPTFTSPVSCGSGNEEYWFTLSYGDDCGGGGGCDPDFNADGNVDQDDIACLSQVVAGDPSCSDADPDFNGDGNVDQDDIDALSQVVAGAPCP